MNSNIKSAVIGGLTATFVVAAAFAPRLIDSPRHDEVTFRSSSAEGAQDGAAPEITSEPAVGSTSSSLPTVATNPAGQTEPSTTSTAQSRPTTTTTRPPTTTTTLAPSTTTTLPAPTVQVTFEPGASSGMLHYTTPRHYDAGVCFEATLPDGSTSRFHSSFRGFAPAEGQFAVFPYPPLGPMAALKLINFNYAPPSYDPLPDPCAGH
jgi:hypothetical protein